MAPIAAVANVALGFIAIAALFSEWSVQSVNNPNKPEADLSSRSNYLFSTEVCQHRYGEVPIASNFAPYHPLDCNTYSSWSAYFNTLSNIGEYNYNAFAKAELQNAIMVSAAFAVIATALNVFNGFSAIIALFNAAFAPAGDLVKDVVARSVNLNLAAAAAWLVSWAVNIRFLQLNAMAITELYDSDPAKNQLFEVLNKLLGTELPVPDLEEADINGVFTYYTAGFILALIATALSLLIAVLAWVGSAAPLTAAPGRGSATGLRLSVAAFFAIAAFLTAIGALVTPWASMNVKAKSAADDITNPSLSLVEPVLPTFGAGPSIASASYGLFSYEFCSSSQSSAAWNPAYWTALVTDLDDKKPSFLSVNTSLTLAPVALDCERLTPSAYYTAPYTIFGTYGQQKDELDYSNTVGAFQAAVVAVSAIGVYVILAVANAAAAGHTAVFASSTPFEYNVTTAFWVFVLVTLLSTFTWPIYAALAWYTLPDITSTTSTEYFDGALSSWSYSEGFVLSIISGVLSYFTVVALYLALSVERATPGIAEFAVSFVTPWVKRDAPPPAPKTEVAFAPKAAAARIASLRSAVIASLICGAGFAALFGEWEFQFVSQQDTGLMFSRSTGLIEYSECNVADFTFAGIDSFEDVLVPPTLSEKLAAGSLQCEDYLANDYFSYFTLPTGANTAAEWALDRATISFVVLALIAALVGFYVTVTSAFVKQTASSGHVLSIASAVAGLIFWPIAWACYAAAWQKDTDSIEFKRLAYALAFSAGGEVHPESFEADNYFGYAFSLAVIANGLCFVWLVDFFLYTRPALAAAEEEDKAPAAPAESVVVSA